ncbi:MAG: hydroxylamine reductase [Deltaproteobacteria bacterium]|nr:hydroxylamine reductase [Deltaproteobacteria bacterium]MBW2247129.1 hydroxylamine reductase [Deltaproteobacteria bacterium]MBW2597667.1 hydroxylamine reductase [Deltaproteobacteria bacterium]MBW2640025.1 hydroxylamine reductase [Deltaproteobacteria bacterium]MBW2680528.1 hydroxylamine reductase [Deltaproteobacteria bacterium]
MFCFQCEQTSKGEGCTKIGVCGKQPDVAALQDLLLYAVKGLSQVAVEGRKVGINDKKLDHFACEAIFSTLTNVDFDSNRFVRLINETVRRREDLKEKVTAAGGKVDFAEGPATFIPEATKEALVNQGEQVGVKSDPAMDQDILSLRELLIYGLKGLAAYADHAAILGREDDTVYAFVHEAMAATLDKGLSVEDYIGLVMKCGEINFKAMELLDAANTGVYGHPVPTPVPLGAKKGKAILVSGHDLKDIEEILKQSKDKGIYVYTHGEMLPCHGYPELKKYPHFYGHYGTAWQNQAKEFDKFPGAILMTTNCIQKPRDSYKDHIFTTGLVGWPGVRHIADKNFTPVIEKALELPGFLEDQNGKKVMVGFGHNAVMGVADKIIEAVKNKAIRHFFLVGGCDGAKPGRDYYTRFVEQVPDDCVVLTLACGKFRFFDKDLGDIGGIPRLLDVGQCNDAYSAIQIAVALADAFNCGVNDLPLSMILSWYEQKACAILLTLLYLGVKDIRLGPTLPAFVSPNVLNVLVEKFNIMPIKTPEEDLKAILG